ncbi:DNA topoisomerase 3 [Porphyromonas pogonae]|uniref:DNA topoisomerase 3 n=1 Tax=Porphyromonas pogonae TaxID=867595 RepID=UPI002E798496|nr:DNA topoisomerase 3 [Porphyromonas pogonae]
MIVCIAEKPSVAREIAAILGATSRKQGYIEGNGYQVTWTYGHLCTLKEPHDYTPYWKPWSLSGLPMIPDRFGIKLIEQDSYMRQAEVIGSIVKNAEMVVNCGDAGQEGELIQRWVLQKVQCQCPVKRLWISSLTDEAIREGFQHLRDEEDFRSLYEAGLARAIGDWLLGMNATRLYTLKYAKSRQVLSIGRVQTPTLALIVNRQREIEHFKPVTYWELKTVYRDTTFNASKGKFDTEPKAREALEAITGSTFEIKDVKKKKGKEGPPKLFDLTSLQVVCNKKFNMSAEETLSTIQSLYEKKITTYPRVDTTYLSEDIYPKIPKILTGLVAYRELTAPLLGGAPLRKNKKVFDNDKVTDHHAIIPTGQPVHGLTEKEQQVFDIITLHFIAAFYPDCDFSTTTVQGEAGKVPFKTSGKEILNPGWRMVFSNNEEDEEDDSADDSSSNKPSGKVLPTFKVGESGDHKPDLQEKQTQPPKPYTEATLLRAMETAGKSVQDDDLREALKENGIGRPSTRANIIETLFKRNYIVKERKSLRATATGLELIDTINYELLKSAELTGQWECKLRKIERKELSAALFVDELKQLVQQLVQDVMRGNVGGRQAGGQASEAPDLPVCPSCGAGYIVKGKTAYGCSAYAQGCAFRLSFDKYASDMTNEQLKRVIKEIKQQEI